MRLWLFEPQVTNGSLCKGNFMKIINNRVANNSSAQTRNLTKLCVNSDVLTPGKHRHGHNNGYRKEICHFVYTENKKEITITNW
jgi:hypothetical protein